jgi:thymidylate synthase (FAD)
MPSTVIMEGEPTVAELQVQLIAHTWQPELTAAAAARLCYSDSSAVDLMARMPEGQRDKLLRRVIEAGHLSIIEHASFTFAIDGLSRAASHQLVRHRMASYSQQSQRYVRLDRPEFVMPPTVASNEEARRVFETGVKSAQDLYRRLLALGMPAEDARYVLPNATCTRLVMTMNARELIHASSLRLCVHAQWEIRRLFRMLKSEIAKVSPLISDYLEPKCIRKGYCDEQETCGLRPKVMIAGGDTADGSKTVC